MTLTQIAEAVAPHGLTVMGHDTARVLIGTDAGWWDVFTHSPEYHDQAKDPVDRWSKRILNALANQIGAKATYPSDGPPYAPFIAWALATGRFWQSPTGMMIHDTAGLMISIRGALTLPAPLEAPEAGQSPCATCTDRPCVTACPVGALSATELYDVPACKAYLDTPGGGQCMTMGCEVRRACPVSQRFARPAAQSAFHMEAFRG
ncbi:ferredoxin [uncultured Tateyamaria sp.]|uniref:ferredoxin n=1 Tax=uncultured Tateyamaria sp. TaxID=455651 RepID=UPI00261607A6|nr:ferredoxin [uncultured Tateyamaria sp.]